MFIEVNDYLARAQKCRYGPRGPRQGMVAPTASSCDCVSPRVACETNGTGEIVQRCLKCGSISAVDRRTGTPITNKRRAAELKMFGPVEAP